MDCQQSDQRAGTFVLRGGGYKVFGATLAVMMLFCCICGLGEGLSRGLLGPAVLCGTASALVGTGLARWIRARVQVTDAGLLLRTPFRTHHLTWAQVQRADIVPTNANHFVAVVRVRTTDGRSIKIDGVGARWRNHGLDETPVGRAVRLINLYATGGS